VTNSISTVHVVVDALVAPPPDGVVAGGVLGAGVLDGLTQ